MSSKLVRNADGHEISYLHLGSALRQVIDWGVATYPGRFGLMNTTLNANSSTVYYPNEAIYTYKDTQPVGFQMLANSR